MVTLLIAAIVFGGVWYLLARAGAHIFVVAAVAYFVAALVPALLGAL
jgi:hypothetical protein